MLNFVRKKNKRFIFFTFFHIKFEVLKSFKIYQKGGKKDEKELFKQSRSIGHDSVHGGDPGSAGHASSGKSNDNNY